jgi:hypothetical protein
LDFNHWNNTLSLVSIFFNDRIEEQFPLGINNQILTIKFRVHLDPNWDSILVRFLNPTFFFWCKFPPKGLGKLGPMKGIKGKKVTKVDGITKNN